MFRVTIKDINTDRVRYQGEFKTRAQAEEWFERFQRKPIWDASLFNVEVENIEQELQDKEDAQKGIESQRVAPEIIGKLRERMIKAQRQNPNANLMPFFNYLKDILVTIDLGFYPIAIQMIKELDLTLKPNGLPNSLILGILNELERFEGQDLTTSL